MIQIENLNISSKQQLINYFQKCQEDRTILRDGLRNPDNEQIAWYKNEVQNDGGLSALAKVRKRSTRTYKGVNHFSSGTKSHRF